jgi:5-oxoprolinase (ATP-hydrolysing) subunit A
MPLDFNADLAEGCPHDAELMQYVTSVNIACGLHAGSPSTMMQALTEAKVRNLRIGAHPGYADREHFGRREISIGLDELFHLVLYQVGALKALANELDIQVSYLKPHGAMYHQSAREATLATAIVDAAKQHSLAVMGQPNTKLHSACQQSGIPYIKEGFADRRYQSNGNLVPRTQPNAMLHDPKQSVEQIQWLTTTLGVESICVHGDNPQAVAFIRDVQALLVQQGRSA